MAFPLAAFFLSYLLTAAAGDANASVMPHVTGYFYTDQIYVNASTVARLVDYHYTKATGELLPGVLYNNSINASWAVDSSALSGLDGQILIVKVTASALNNSDIAFVSTPDFQQSSAVAYLQCVVVNGTCSNSSNLSALIPFTISVNEVKTIDGIISLKSEILGAAPAMDAGVIQNATGGLFDSLKNMFSQNDSSSGQNNTALAPAAAANSSNSSSGDFLDSLKPEGDSKNPLDFLRANPLISIAALAIVIIITGAYLVNSKD